MSVKEVEKELIDATKETEKEVEKGGTKLHKDLYFNKV